MMTGLMERAIGIERRIQLGKLTDCTQGRCAAIAYPLVHSGRPDTMA
jgi:hypothetical protein